MSGVHYIEVVRAARETVAKMLTQRTRQRGFNAIVTTNGGKTAAVVRDGLKVRLDLPSLAPDAMLTRAEADRMVAYLVHEVCHCLHTDYVAWNRAVAAGHRVQHWTNALEDVRIEALEMKLGPYKAMRSMLSGLVSHLYAETHTTLGEQGKSLGDSALNAPYIFTILGRAANGYDVPITAPLKPSLSPRVRPVINAALARIKACKTTWDCLALAKDLVALEQTLKPQQDGPKGNPMGPQPPQPPQEGGEGEQGQGDDLDNDDQGDDDTMRQGDTGDDQGEDAEADDQGKGQESAEGDDGQGEQEGEQGQADDTEDDQGGHGEADDQGEKAKNDDLGPKDGQPGGQGAGSKDDQEEDQGEEINPDLNLGDTAENIMERTGTEPGPRDTAHHLNSMTVTRSKANCYHDAPTAKAHLDRETPANGILHGQISRLLVSVARNVQTHHETSGRLDRRALVRMRTGAPDVFSRRDYCAGIDTAVLVLIDLSGSMGHRIELARVTAWALANAAESAGGKLAICGFKGDAADCFLEYVKDWSQTAYQAAGTLCSMQADSCTPLSASIVAGAQDLAEQPATRRILIALTDGQCDLGADAVKSACALAAACGVEAVGIGMNCEEVVKAFPPQYSVNVLDMQQLASTGLGTLARMLEDTGGR